jgi:uncharacterized protein YndB with AHSA1/START domain
MAARSNAAVESAERELVITRVFDAPRSLVFKAWTDPEHRARWMGPKGFTGEVIKMDVQPGGEYRFYMRSPEGNDHWQQGVFREIVEPERLVLTYAWADADGRPTRPETLLTLNFEEHDGKTKLTLHQALFESVSARDAHRGGWSSSFERLADCLAAA